MQAFWHDVKDGIVGFSQAARQAPDLNLQSLYDKEKFISVNGRGKRE